MTFSWGQSSVGLNLSTCLSLDQGQSKYVTLQRQYLLLHLDDAMLLQPQTALPLTNFKGGWIIDEIKLPLYIITVEFC